VLVRVAIWLKVGIPRSITLHCRSRSESSWTSFIESICKTVLDAKFIIIRLTVDAAGADESSWSGMSCRHAWRVRSQRNLNSRSERRKNFGEQVVALERAAHHVHHGDDVDGLNLPDGRVVVENPPPQLPRVLEMFWPGLDRIEVAL
jgi:hypothetical protein